MTRRAGLLATCTLLAAAALAGEEKLRRTEIIVGGVPVTMVEYEGRTYRTISAADLAGKRLAGQPCCVEGKYKEYVGDRLYLFDVDASFPVASALVRDIRPGDNVFLAGRVRARGRGAVLTVSVVIKLGSDTEVFERRFARCRAEGRAEALIELGRWIKRAKERSTRLDFREFERYDAMRARALRGGLALLEAKLDGKDAEGFYRLGLRTLELVNDEAAATRLFLRATAADPEHGSSTQRLAAAGYVRHGDAWVTAAERDRLVEEEKERREAARLAAGKAHQAALESARRMASNNAAQRMWIELELAKAEKPEESLLSSLGGNKVLTENRLHVLELAARLPGKDAVGVLVAGSRDAERVVRARAVDLLAVRPEPEARAALGAAARENEDEVTALRAVEALAWANDRPARMALAELLKTKKKPVAAAARAALVKLRGGPLEGVEAWRAWAGTGGGE